MAQHCPLCPSPEARAVFTDAHGTVMACAGCGLQYAAAYPEYDVADHEIYDFEYFRKALEPEEVAARENLFAQLLGQIEAQRPQKGRLLDIGAGEGTLMRAALSRGWDVEGTDVASAMVDYTAREFGLTMHHGALEDLPLEERSFDAVIMNHVLEHVQNPKTTLETAARLLKPGGVIRIEVPNITGLSSRFKSWQSRWKLKKSPWKHYSTDHHFWFFTAETLRRMLEASGFRVLQMRAPLKQFTPMKWNHRLANPMYRQFNWGGVLVTLATPVRAAASVAPLHGHEKADTAPQAMSADLPTPASPPDDVTRP